LKGNFICAMKNVAEKLEVVWENIGKFAEKSGRTADDIKLVAVSKTHPVDKIMQVYEAGHRVFGENRVQEALRKIPNLPEDITWHLVGHLQTNKANHALEAFDVIESVDSIKLTGRLERAGERYDRDIDILIQVDLAGEETKYGVDEKKYYELLEVILDTKRLKLKGLMCLPPFFSEAEKTRPYFVRLRELMEKTNSKYNLNLEELSMGMSLDYTVAIEEGATIVRVGTAIFGEREY